ncbi:MAG: hypothetical protein H7A25_12195 [Leptospiraceae bacterium]|nr:hypothetical protein [Leptospiraceae bacterium]
MSVLKSFIFLKVLALSIIVLVFLSEVLWLFRTESSLSIVGHGIHLIILICIFLFYILTYNWQKKRQDKLDILYYLLDKSSRGDMSVELDITTLNEKEELDKILLNFFKMLSFQKSMITVLKDTSNKMSYTYEQANIRNKDYTQKVQSQVASTEEISAALDEINENMVHIFASSEENLKVLTELIDKIQNLSTQIEEINDNTIETIQISEGISVMVEEGEHALRDMNAGINNITESSKKITQIVTIIKEISDRVNLLSLNASIEAARAGEYGKGFAVVAQEVSKLADQTASSIKEIEDNVKKNNHDISLSRHRIEKTNEVFQKIVKQIEGVIGKIYTVSSLLKDLVNIRDALLEQSGLVNDKTAGINYALQEQKGAHEDIYTAVIYISETIQQVSKDSEKISQAIVDMDLAVKDLDGISNMLKH